MIEHHAAARGQAGLPHHHLQLGAAVVEIQEGRLPVAPQGSHSARNSQPDLARLELIGASRAEAPMDLCRFEIELDPVGIGRDASLFERRPLLPPNGDL
jgi:hypothetical protein